LSSGDSAALKGNNMPEMTQPAHFHFAIQQHLETSFNLINNLCGSMDVKFDWDFGLTSEGDGKHSPDSCAVWLSRDINNSSQGLWFKSRLENACNAVGYTIKDAFTKDGRLVLFIEHSNEIKANYEDAYCCDNDC
jgi:hypothetical protein